MAINGHESGGHGIVRANGFGVLDHVDDPCQGVAELGERGLRGREASAQAQPDGEVGGGDVDADDLFNLRRSSSHRQVSSDGARAARYW